MGNSQSAELQLAVMANILIKRPVPHTDHTFYSNLLTLPTTADDIYQNFTLETLRNILTHQKPNYATLLKVAVMELHAIVWRGKQTVRVQSAASLHPLAAQSAGSGSEWVGERKERLLSCLRLLTRLMAVVNESPDRDIRQFMCGSVLAGMMEAEEEKRRQRLAAEARKERERRNAAEMERRALAVAIEREKERQKEEQVRVEREAKAATAAAEAAQAAALLAKQAKQPTVDVNGAGGNSPTQGSPTHGSPFAGGSTSSPKRDSGKEEEEGEFASEDEGRVDIPSSGGVDGASESEVAVAQMVDDSGQVTEMEIVVRRDGPDGSGAAAPNAEAETTSSGSVPASTAGHSNAQGMSDFDFISAVASKTDAAGGEQGATESTAVVAEAAASNGATASPEQTTTVELKSTQVADNVAPLAAAADTGSAPPTQPLPDHSADIINTAAASESTITPAETSQASASTDASEPASTEASSSASASASSSDVPSASTAASGTSTPATSLPAPLPPISLDSWWVGELYGQPLHSLLASLLIDLCFLPSFTSPLTSTPSVSRHELILGKCWAVGAGFPAKLANEAYSTGGDRAAEEWELDGNRVEVLRCLLACVSAPMFRSVVRHDDVIVGNVVGERRELSVTLAYSMLNVLLGWRVETTVPYAQAIWTDYRKPLVEMCAHLLMVLLDHQVIKAEPDTEEDDESEDDRDVALGRSISAVSQSQLTRSDSVASTTSTSSFPPSIRVPNNASVSTSALTTSRHSNPSTQQQIEQQQTLRYSPHHNLFSDHLYSLSPPDCTYFYSSVCRLLHHGMMAYATWLPSSSTGLSLEAELLVLMWKMLDNHPQFLSHVLNECDVLSLFTPLLFYCFDARKDASRLGLLYTGVFTLLKLSGEREFAVQLNNAMPTAPLAHLPIVHLLGMPELQGGTYADALVLVAHKLIVSSPNHLDALLKVLLTLLANVSPYITRLSAISALRLVSLFELFCQPAYIYGKEHNHVYAALLLDLFNNLIQYQWQGSGPLVLAIVRRAEVFYSLRVVSEAGQHYVQPMTGVGAKGHAMVFRERHRAAGIANAQPTTPRRSTSAAVGGPAGATSTAPAAHAPIDQPNSTAPTLTPPSTSPQPSVDSAADATTPRSLSASQPLPTIPPAHEDSPTASTATLPASHSLSQSVSTPTNRRSTTTDTFDSPAPNTTPPHPLAIPPFHLEQYATPSFHPTHAWATAWKQRLPLETIYRLYDHILPKVVAMASQATLTDERLLQFITAQTLVGILPLPHAIVVRRYIRNEWTNSWFSVYLWGLVFLRQQQPKLFDGKKVRLFAISSRGGGGSGGSSDSEQTAEAEVVGQGGK